VHKLTLSALFVKTLQNYNLFLNCANIFEEKNADFCKIFSKLALKFDFVGILRENSVSVIL